MTVRGTGRLLAQQVITALAEADVTIVDLAFRQPNLEDAFLALTGGAQGGEPG